MRVLLISGNREDVDFVAVVERQGEGGAPLRDVLLVHEDVDVGPYPARLVADAVAEAVVLAVGLVEELAEGVGLHGKIGRDAEVPHQHPGGVDLDGHGILMRSGG